MHITDWLIDSKCLRLVRREYRDNDEEATKALNSTGDKPKVFDNINWQVVNQIAADGTKYGFLPMVAMAYISMVTGEWM